MKLLVGLAMMVTLPALAQQIHVMYEGTVRSMTYADCTSFANSYCSAWSFTQIPTASFPPGQQASVGDKFAGGFTYDAAAPLTAMSDDGFQAVHLNAITQARFSTSTFHLPNAGLLISSAGSFSVVDNRNGYDSFYLEQGFSEGNWFAHVNFHLQDSTGKAFTGFSVPTHLTLDQFNANVFSIGIVRLSDGDQVQLHGTLTGLTFAAAVPEPSSAALLVTGGALLLTARRRRH